MQKQKKEKEKAEKERIRAARLKVKYQQEDSQDAQQQEEESQDSQQQYDSQQPYEDSQHSLETSNADNDGDCDYVTVYDSQTQATAEAGFSVPESLKGLIKNPSKREFDGNDRFVASSAHQCDS